MIKRVLLVVVIVATLLLSFIIGLTVRAQQQYSVYLPMIVARRSKIGIAPGGYVTGDLDYLGASWTYRWNNQWFTDTVPEWVDMLWSDRYFYMPIRSDTILGFNEPDLRGQADMTPTQGAVAWHWIETAYPTRTLVSPAPSQLHPEWLWQMVAEYELLYGTHPRFDGIAVHYYRWDKSMPMASEYLQQRRDDELASGYNVPLWLTETGACHVDEIAYFKNMASFVERTDWMARAAVYKISPDVYDPSLCSSMLIDGTLTQLGQAYREWVGNGF